MDSILKVNCDTFSGEAKNSCLEKKKQIMMRWTQVRPVFGTGTPNPPPPRRDGDNGTGTLMPRPPKDGSGSGWMMPRPPKPEGRNDEIKPPQEALTLAIAKLSPADREELMKIIGNYLTAKGISLPPVWIQPNWKDLRGNGKIDIRDFSRGKGDTTNSGNQDKKNYVGHVTLIKQ